MALRPIVRLGHPALRSPAEAVTPEALAGAPIQAMIDDLFETMAAADGVGLAAPQIAEGLQLFVYTRVRPDGEPEPEGHRVVVNPMIEPLAGTLVYDWEGCLSIPELRGLVPRHPSVRVRALDRDGERVTFVADGYEARIIQHEFDHLNGVVFLDRMRDLRSLAFGDEWETYMTDDGEPTVG